MTAIAEIDKDSLFGGDLDASDSVRLSISPPPEVNSSGFYSSRGRGSIVPSLAITKSRIQIIQ